MIIKPKGTYDLFGEESNKVLYLNLVIQNLMETFNYNYIRTPGFEASEVFHRGVGETTDIVKKETYDFLDRGDRKMTLRPEGTAAIARCYIENKMHADGMLKKFWYYEPMYRYERPQSGRFREHYQFGCEVFGSEEPMIDAEIISIPCTLFALLGLKGIKVKINSLGDQESRNNYREALVDYLKPHLDSLCSDCQERYKKNPLRILDCKVDKDSKVLKNVPTTIDYLNKDSKEYFEKVLKYLDALEIDYVVNPKTVRGLDYYTHTVFEIEAAIEKFGTQNVLCGGGRYNNLVESLGGSSVPGLGFGLGTERLILALDAENINIAGKLGLDCYIIPMSDEEKEFGIALCNSLRILGFKAEIDHLNKSVKNNFKYAEKLNSIFTIVIGPDEIKNNYVTIKNMLTKKEEKIDNMNIINYLYSSLEETNNSCGCSDEDCDCKNCDCDDNGNSESCHCGENCECDDCECDDEEKTCHCHEKE